MLFVLPGAGACDSNRKRQPPTRQERNFIVLRQPTRKSPVHPPHKHAMALLFFRLIFSGKAQTQKLTDSGINLILTCYQPKNHRA
jgi:hypothetical protein